MGEATLGFDSYASGTESRRMMLVRSGTMKYRIPIWAGAGFLVAGLWALYFAIRGKDNPIEPMVYTLGVLTQPVVLIGSYFHFGMSFYLVILANAVTYALIGLIVESLRHPLHHAKFKTAHTSYRHIAH